MSAWGKFLAPITIPSGGYTFAWETNADSPKVTVAAGTYGTILSVAAALDAAMDAEATTEVSVSSVGRITIASLGMTDVAFAACSDGLLSILGFAESETVTSGSVTAASAHLYGWYPGVISHGEARGDGLAADSSWRVVDEAGRVLAGSGAMRSIAPSRRAYSRALRWAAIRRSEYEHRTRGVALLEEYGATRALRWYPDRDIGTPSSQGTQADPASTRTNASGYYWLVMLASAPAVDWSPQYPDLCSVSLELNGEPA